MLRPERLRSGSSIDGHVRATELESVILDAAWEQLIRPLQQQNCAEP
jgi:hypothetical protein